MHPVGREPVVMALGTGRLRWAYEATMIALALFVAYLLTVPNEGWVNTANLVVWGIFVVDYGVRLALSTDRRTFVRRNIPDLIAILPLDFFRVARLARLARLVRLLRAGTVLWRASRDLRGIVGTNGLGYVLTVTVGVVLLGGVIIEAVEPDMGSLGDGLWWSLVTATTVGYGDLSPVTIVGRVVAGALMVIGIGTIGMVTGSIATYFIHGRRVEDRPTDVVYVSERLEAWADLAPTERRRLAVLLADCANDGEPSAGD